MRDRHHIIEVDGRLEFQSDKHPWLPPGEIILSFKEPAARNALRICGIYCKDPDKPPGKVLLSFKDPAAQAVLRVYGAICLDRDLGKDILEVLDDKAKRG